MRLNLHLLRVFFAVANEESFSAAARRLHISQPAVSKAVSELERQLGTDLLIRTGGRADKRLALTDAGSSLYEHARGIFALEQAALEDMSARTGLQRGRLIIGASTTMASYWLPPYLASFARDHPAIELRVVVGNTHTIVQELLDCHLAMALVEGPVSEPNVAVRKWRREALSIVAAPGNHTGGNDLTGSPQLSARELSQHTWLVREGGSGTADVTRHLLEHYGITPRRVIEIGSNEGIARAAAAGAGTAVLPAVMVSDLIQLGLLAELRLRDVATLTRPLFLLEREGRPLPPAAVAFKELLETLCSGS